jgi:hypothetical protein
MTEFNGNNNIVDNKDAAVIAGAIGGYLGHNRFKILSIKERVKKNTVSDNRIGNRGLFSFMSSWRTND